MKKSLWLVCVAVAVLCWTSGCKTSYLDGGADGLYAPVPTHVSHYYTQYNVSDDLVTDSGEASVLFWFFQFSEGKYCLRNSAPNVSLLGSILKFLSPSQIVVENAKRAALYNALSKTNADQLLGASYEYTVTDYIVFSKVECKVKGFPATVKNVKFHDKKPIILNAWQRIEYLAPQDCLVDYTKQGPISLNNLSFPIGK